MPRGAPGLTRLERERLSPVYRHRLEECWHHLATWLSALGIAPSRAFGSAAKADAVLVNYVNQAFGIQTPFYVAKHAVLYVMWCWHHLRGRLPRTWGALKGWHQRLPWRPRTPLSSDVTQLFFLYALESCFSVRSGAERELVFVLGLLSWLNFECLLRPVEAFNLRVCDVRIIHRLGQHDLAVVGILQPKTRAHMGRHQFATCRDPGLVRWISWFWAGREASRKRVWSSSQARYRRMFKEMFTALGFGAMGYTPASGRAGGATHRFMAGETIERLSYIGRWASISTLKAYIQEAMATLVWAVVPSEIEYQAAFRLRQFAHVLAAPPTKPALAFFPWRA